MTRLVPRRAARRGLSLAGQSISRTHHRGRDLERGTYIRDTPKELRTDIFRAPPVEFLLRERAKWRALAENYLAHRFDLLGSGWVRVAHDTASRGLEGHVYRGGGAVRPDREGHWLESRINASNVESSRAVWRLVRESHAPIDWQLDFKSGYRWSEKIWYRDIRYADAPGADIKIPWELARMQHLPHLAWAHLLSRDSARGFASARDYADEFRDQILDFIACNPPRFGVNWRCTMDVAIRAANWLVALNLFADAGARFDADFLAVLKRSIREHAVHIANHLEWHPLQRGNHYLANIVGLAFIAAYLPAEEESDAWLAFALRQLVHEVNRQFLRDGANFEGSTSYHRLGAEMAAFATALVWSLEPARLERIRALDYRAAGFHPTTAWGRIPHIPPRNAKDWPFPAWYTERLERMAEFAIHIRKPGGRAVQIGDNDNGRFLKLDMACRRFSVSRVKVLFVSPGEYRDLPKDADYWMEDHLDHAGLVSAANQFFRRSDFDEFSGHARIASAVLRTILEDRSVPSYRLRSGANPPDSIRIGDQRTWREFVAMADGVERRGKAAVDLKFPGPDLRQRLELFAYPAFGLYIYRSERLYMSVRCGEVGQNGRGGHDHVDQLAIELTVDGEDIFSDPGTYLYTPDKEARNRYRSVHAHFAPKMHTVEPARLDDGLFALGAAAAGECLFFGVQGFVGEHAGYGAKLRRMIILYPQEIRIVDHWPRKILGTPCSPTSRDSLPFSPGYGIQENFPE